MFAGGAKNAPPPTMKFLLRKVCKKDLFAVLPELIFLFAAALINYA
jgi:hypothetical protein